MAGYIMHEYNMAHEPKVTNWTNELFAIDTAYAILRSQGFPPYIRDYSHMKLISADLGERNGAGTSVFIIKPK
jgi:hypothetical protein